MKNFDALMRVVLKPWVLLMFCTIIVLSYFYCDIAIATYFHDLDVRGKWPIWVTISELTHGTYYLLIFLMLALVCRYVLKNKYWEARCWVLFWCLVVPYGIAGVLKNISGRARPQLWFSDHIYGFFGWHHEKVYWSFPSGHTTTAISVMVAGMIIWPR